MKFLKQIILLSSVIFSLQTSASILIEPHVAYQFAGKNDDAVPPTTFSGSQYGARLGMQTFGLMAGADYTRSNLTIKQTGVADKDSHRDQIGAFVGYKFPILLRVWGTYYFSDKVTAPSNDYVSGSGTELGIGFTGLPFLSVNLMYKTSNYDSYSISGTKGTLSPKEKTSEIALGVSIPFHL
jgi:hypothetical protein